MSRLFLVAALSFVCLTQVASAGDIVKGRVTGVYCGIYSGKNMCSVHIDTDSINTPTCATIKNRMQLQVDTAIGRAMLSVALAANAQDKPVYVGGLGTCNIWSDTEDMNVIFISPGW